MSQGFNNISEIKRALHGDYESSDLHMGQRIDELRKSLLPNELLYVVDYTKVDIENVSGGKVANQIIGNQLKTVEDLLDHAKPKFQKHLINFSVTIGHLVAKRGVGVPEDLCSCIYTSDQGKTIYKRTALLFKEEGNITHTFGILTDLSGLGLSANHFSFDITGPNRDHYLAAIHRLEVFSKILSPREIEVLSCVQLGMNSRQIAEKLFISGHTVRTHRKNITKKLEVCNSMAAVNKALELGLL